MIDCAKARELANAYIDNMADDADCTAYEEHIACCDACREEYDILRKISSDLALTEAPLPEGFAKRMHTALVKEQFEAQKKEEKKKFIFPYYRAASVVAAALVIAVIGKYGVYDTYKKVTEDTVHVASEIDEEPAPKNEHDAVTPVENTVWDAPDSDTEMKTAEPSADKEKTQPAEVPAYTVRTRVQTEETSEEATPHAVLEVPSVPEETNSPVQVASADTIEPAITVAEAVPASEPADDTTLAKAAARAVPSADVESAVTESYDNMPAMASLTTDSADMPDDMPVTEKTDEPVSSGGGSAAAGGGSSAESVPAEVSIYNSDGSKMMFKKYLLTFIDGNNITDNGEEITITVDEEEYGNVMEHLRTNEYVKSVTEGTPSDGKAIINIK